MPELCRFFGIIIYMYREINSRHNYPHIHAEYSGEQAVFNINTAELIEGHTFPNKQKKLVEAWIELRKNELQQNWNMLNTTKENPTFFKIDPLQ